MTASYAQVTPLTRPIVVSVVTVCLNAVETIDETVASVLSQTYPRIEYVVVDGGSTDGTVACLRSHGSDITRLISEPDSGLYNAMNTALRVVTGDVLFFLNSGDLLASPSVIEMVAGIFAADPIAGLVYGDHQAWFSPSRILRMHQAKVLTRWELWLKAVCHQTIFGRRELFERLGGFDERLRICADWDWMIRAVLIDGYKAVHLEEPVCYFRMGGICGNRISLQRERAELHRRYFSRRERLLFPLREFVYKTAVRLRSRDFSLPWVFRRTTNKWTM